MPYCLAQACRLEHLNQYSEALALLENGIAEALLNGPTLLLGMAYERAGRLVKKWTGSDFLGRTFLSCAFQTYKDYGASAKCDTMAKYDSYLGQITSAIPMSLTMPSPTGANIQSAHSGSGSGSGSSISTSNNSSDSVDLATLISAVSTWQREKSASRVAASLVNILIKSMVRI